MSTKILLINRFIPPDYPDVHSAEEVVIIGAGPTGLFAALTLIEKDKNLYLLKERKMSEIASPI